MAVFRTKRHWFIGLGFVVLFLLLLALRLDLFDRGRYQLFSSRDGKAPYLSAVQGFQDKESWMNISQNERKIGYSHRLFSRTEKGYHLSESVFLQLNTMGVVQGLTIKTDGNLNPDMTLSSFDLDLRSSLFRFQAHGVVSGNHVTLYTEMPGSEKKTVLTLKDAPHLANGLLESANLTEMKDGETRKINVFDPATMGQRPVKLTMLGDDVITIMGHERRARKISVDFMGARQLAWIGEGGDILKEQGILGITLEQVTKGQALDGITASADLTEIASIPSNMVIDDAARLAMLKVRITNIEKTNIKLNGGRQSLKKDVLVIQKEAIPTRPLRDASIPGNEGFLKPSLFIQSDDQRIVSKVQEIISPDDPVSLKASKLVAWVYKNVEKRPVLSVPNALDTLNNLVGDCNEHAVLLAALARAAGIPAQVEVGLVYQRGRFYYHAWNILFIGTWVTADAVMNQMPADVTHIRFARGEADQQTDLIGVIGKVRLTVLDKSR